MSEAQLSIDRPMESATAAADAIAQKLAPLISLADVEQRALEILGKSVRDYFQSGADDEQTLARNIRAFRRFFLHFTFFGVKWND